MRGLDIFRQWFSGYIDQYMLIGGTACNLAMREAGLEFRATKDLDIVLCVEVLSTSFVEAFWAFVAEGGYQVQQRAQGGKQFYRFQKPQAASFPAMLELFSRAPEGLPLAPGSHLTPIPMTEEVSSLSAILMDDDYYAFIRSTTSIVDGLPVVGPAGLIPLKARAWLDLSDRAAKGEQVDSRDIKKHRNDIFRLYRVLDPAVRLSVPEKVKADMAHFIEQVSGEGVDLKAFGVLSVDLPSLLAELRTIFGLG